MSDSSGSPDLSIVVAGVNVGRTLGRWFEAILPQLGGRRVEVLLTLAERDASSAAPAVSSELVHVVTVPGEPLVPHLWAVGIAKARGRVVATTITPCLPAPDWIDAILTAHAARRPGVGGTIDIASEATVVDRAVHLVRYTPYLPAVGAGPTTEIAADNAAYLRAELETMAAVIEREGFWEAEFHHALRQRGEGLWLDPSIRVEHRDAYSVAAFSRQRFAHGRRFGRSRGATESTWRRLARLPGALVVPPLMLVRIVRRLAERGRFDLRMAAALPLALWFLACWAIGEAVGQFDG